ncbi:hypothetical protein QJQ58_09235 [Paenibacillus dendritiformis]|uniref:hypothetical protein n=1 Tax=Paenibacillus dendritiformis TaxID=130049 RepID=UPI00248C4696|nr:hypothetical protein [Paenibacillus dendritiformis]WGU96396.1 hypothetical protein QJQ58_09235 [Paenibacillus dendritiformis]
METNSAKYRKQTYPSGSKRQAMTRSLVTLLAGAAGPARNISEAGRAGRSQPADVAAAHRNEDFTEQAARTMIAELNEINRITG